MTTLNSTTNIIGIGGLPRSGKDTLAELLVDAGYFGFSFGDFIRAEARRRHADRPDPISIANMTETSNWLREIHGADVVLQAALKEFNEQQKAGAKYRGLVLFSVRAPVEVDWILDHSGELVWVEADDAVRHQRNLQHQRKGEATLDLAEFKRQEALQWEPQPGIPAEAQMNIAYVKSKATKIIENNDDNLEAFKAKSLKILGTFGGDHTETDVTERD